MWPLVVFLAALWLGGSAHAGIIEQVDPDAEYDYVIVGSGAGGSPLASRLAIYGHRVLLIDAGDDQSDSLIYRIPALHLGASEYPNMTWNFYVNHYPDLERQRRDTKMVWELPSGQEYIGTKPPPEAKPKGVLYPRAGTLGGCTAHNALITVYPDNADWDQIVELTGDQSWASDKMREYFVRLERRRYPASDKGHGLNGWLTTSLFPIQFIVRDFKLNSMILSAASALGRGIDKFFLDIKGISQLFSSDLNSAKPDRDRTEGMFQLVSAIGNGSRSAPNVLLKQVLNNKTYDGQERYHLDVLLNTLVTRIKFDDDSYGRPRAQGVEYVQGKSLYRADPRASKEDSELPPSYVVRAKREVIISGGAFNTPQLLKLSGIGPSEELERYDIPVVVDLPGVGTNLQDRYENTVVTSSQKNFSLTESCTGLQGYDPCLDNWEHKKNIVDRGAYATTGLPVAILKKSSVAEDKTPDLFIGGGLTHFTGYFPGYSAVAGADARHWTWVILKAHTRNRAGTVELSSSDPRDVPIVNFNYFESGSNDNEEADQDAKALAEGLEFARAALRNINHAPMAAKFVEEWPGERVQSKEDLKEWVRNEAWGHHASCTCPIGADGDPMAVLDSSFRVRGVDGLRVVDASVFPRIPGYFIVLPVYMISEKAADVIHGDAMKQTQPYQGGKKGKGRKKGKPRYQ